MFEVDDIVVYENGGVCKIADIGTPDFVKGDAEYYTMQPVSDESGVLYVKTDNTRFILRPVISEEEAESYLEELAALPAMYNGNDKEREKEYKDVLHSCECNQWLSMLKGIVGENEKREADGKRLNMADGKNLQKVERLLLDEFSVAFRITQDEVKDKIKNAMC